ncbi:hypothetical protein VHA01S_014_00140 [Vibrio halioticoli NBRC 102217]|uniref:DUF3301 domain-containing protein n=1 Tax=Vibrio halioticoli NBRC 102217 TaxID=1219072 RepID=V5F1K7_9VIBR|nr:DUF3301 domain-containing protein [Vibrio halioticoli]GAD88989.1 hypothetical protein VHA01S_014_00140 [Vibrio halioticoli NBRC 102217]
MEHLLAILGCAILLTLFWQHRRQAELAKVAISRHCKQLELQIVSISSGSHRIRYPDGKLGWHTVFCFEFSALGDDCYHGELTMHGMRLAHFYTQPYRI